MLTVLRDDPASLADRRIYIVVASDERTEEALQTIREEQKRTRLGDKLDAYQFEPSHKLFPDNSDLICFDRGRGPRGGLTFDGFWHMPEPHLLRRLQHKNTLLFCHKIEKIAGFTEGPTEKWIEILNKTRDDPTWKDCECVEVGDFARRYLGWNG